MIQTGESHQEYLYNLLRDEIQYCRATRVAKLINTAGFQLQHSFSSFDPSEIHFPASVTIESLKALDFYHAGNNLVIYGSTGTWKTMLSICIGMEACQKGIPVKFFRTAALINQLSQAQEHGTLSQLHKRMDKAEIIILDEFGYVPYNKTCSQLLFDYLSEIHEKRGIILNTNLEFSR